MYVSLCSWYTIEIWLLLYILLLIIKYVYNRYNVKNIKKLSSNVTLGKWYIPYVDIILLTNF